MKHASLTIALALAACGPGVGGSPGAETGTTDADPTTAGTTPPGTSTTAEPGTTTDPATTMTPGDATTDPTEGSSGTASSSTGELIECSTFEQNCPDGQKCMPWADDGGNVWNAMRCVPIAEDPDAVGEACTVEESGVSGIDSCDGTSMCFDVDPDTLEGTCFAFCTGDDVDWECPDACDFCTISGSSVVSICLPTCAPLAQDCEAGDGCYPVGSSMPAFACLPDVSEDGGAPGTVCEFVNTCDPGTMCLDEEYLPSCEGAGCCSPFCTVDDPSGCDAIPGTECVPLFEEPSACVAADAGVCAAP